MALDKGCNENGIKVIISLGRVKEGNEREADMEKKEMNGGVVF